MIQYDYSKYEGNVALVSSPRGIWAVETHSRMHRSVRSAGHLPHSTDPHELLLIALNSGLRSITKPQHHKLCSIYKVSKPKLLVTCANSTFLGAVESHILGTPNPFPVRVDRVNLLRELEEQAERFSLTFERATEMKPLNLLKDWANRNVLGGRLFDDVPLHWPTAVSTATQ